MNSIDRYLPISVSDFRTMIDGNYIYVDKTKYIYNLFSTGSRYYFLSHPRRFGKSLLISTLKELFLGNRTLFKNLWIDKSNYQWQEHPVIHLDFGMMDKSSPEKLEESLLWALQEVAKKYNVDITTAPNLSSKFSHLVKQLGEINRVVILIDEYDKPILDALPSVEKAVLMRDTLKNFYEVIKGLDAHIRFVFITGVTKFARTSIFSGLNNLEEITISSQFDILLGYTAEELTHYFMPQLQNAVLKENCSIEQIIEKIALWYDGYKFSQEDNATKVYNPYSTLLFLKHGKFDKYWFKSGTPSFLMELIKVSNFSIFNIEKIVAHESELESFEITKISIKTLLFQTGYLTIDYYDKETDNYHLKLPNFEVRSALLTHLFDAFTGSADAALVQDSMVVVVQALRAHDIDLLCHILQTLFAKIPYNIHIPLERYYQSIIFVLGLILGLQISVEVFTNIGRIDMVIEIDNYAYVIEFKIVGGTEQALVQIETKQYYQKYLLSNKRIILVGIVFDVTKRNIDSWIAKEVES